MAWPANASSPPRANKEGVREGKEFMRLDGN